MNKVANALSSVIISLTYAYAEEEGGGERGSEVLGAEHRPSILSRHEFEGDGVYNFILASLN